MVSRLSPIGDYPQILRKSPKEEMVWAFPKQSYFPEGTILLPEPKYHQI